MSWSLGYLLLCLAVLPSLSLALLDGIYCGRQNCYDVLGVTRESSKSEIGKNYRTLARKFHPDMHRTPDAKAEAEIQFKLIATAYEILKDDGQRNDYDYMLDHPEEYYSHYYRFYARKAPKIDVKIVILATLTIISMCQYYSGWQRYEDAIKYFSTVQKYRHKAMEIAKDEIEKVSSRKNGKRLSKAEQREEVERIIRRVVEENMDVKGGYAKPTLWDVIWVQLLVFPYTLVRYIMWYVNWIWRFTICKEPYGREEQLYLIRRHMKMGQHQFNAQEDKQIEEYLRLELWEREKFDVWKEKQEEEMKKKLAENPRYKSYRRYMKNHGPGRLTFED